MAAGAAKPDEQKGRQMAPFRFDEPCLRFRRSAGLLT
ncbi:hypothetical protein M493_17695 [Geobacillus genomosp. 3]|uniref:Uncharacterized protein n=1 Tax=Geobacillus genomosp. 3 TaxID=1921421 RepID=S6A469_GEOG3|nr:hypothetical protein M493_17695 [Geobacillus genomosp. 3]